MKNLLLTLGILLGSMGSTQPVLVENGLRPAVLIKGEPNNKMNILQRMNYYKVPGISLAVVNEGKIAWTRGYGHYSHDPSSPAVDEHTLFQAGSISKPFTAFGALLLVQQGRVSLDEDVNLYLKRWKVPENEFTKTEKVTLRRLLSHTAGTNVDGFPGYAAQDAMPSIVDILNGKKPQVNTDPVRVVVKPGTELKYSGGGTTIVQLLIEDVTGQPFADWMLDHVLNPLGMTESTFKQPLPPSYAAHAAYGYTQNGAVEGKWHIYPEMGAAGLWTTARDLAKFLVYIQNALNNEKAEPLDSRYVKEMITRQKAGDKEIDAGLGFFMGDQGQDLAFFFKGEDEGFIAKLYGFAYRGQGVVIMMDSDIGWLLMEELTNSVADTYKWPNIKPIEKAEIPGDPDFVNYLPGLYVHEKEEIEVSAKDRKLYLDLKKGLGLMELHRESGCRFFIQAVDITLEFSNCNEKSKSLVMTDPKQIKTVYQRK